MWRADLRRTEDDAVSGAGEETTAEVTPFRAPATPQAETAPVQRHVDTATWSDWREELALLGGRNALLHFEDSPRTRIELGATHPGGLAQFITGKTTLLKNLVRDDLALRAASAAAANITAKGIELGDTRGIDAIRFAVGLAEWRFEKRDYRAPILLRPLGIRRFGRDFELRLRGGLSVNPALVRVLREQFEIDIDVEALASLAHEDGAFQPQPVVDRLRALTSHLQRFQVHPRLLVSSFAEVGPAMVADLTALGRAPHTVVDALAGNQRALDALEDAYAPAEPVRQDERAPAADTLLLDADPEQELVVAQIAAGNSVAVKTLPGTGATQTIVNALGDLVAQHKRVLIVTPRVATLKGIAGRLADTGLPGAAVSARTLRRDLIQSISRNEKAEASNHAEVDDALLRLRSVLLDYRTSLSRRDPVLRVSVLDALGELSRLSLLPDAPSTTARLSRTATDQLAGDRSEAVRTLVRAAEIGEFETGPDASPWFDARFTSSDAALAGHALARRVHEHDLPQMLERADDVLVQTRLRPYQSIAELGIYLRLLLDIRETLDRFLPVVFDRSLGELIAATGPRREAQQMTAMNRRRLRKLAKEYLRPGVHVADMHDQLIRVQQQRVLYQRFVTSGVTPEVPTGIGDTLVAYQQVAADLGALDEPLGTSTTAKSLTALPIEDLRHRLAALAADSEVLENLQERSALVSRLRDLDLDPLLDDLATRHVPQEQVGLELELAWWKSVLERLLTEEKALLGGNTHMVDRLEADFRLVDQAHAATTGKQLAWNLAESWRIGLVDHADEATSLKQLLGAGPVTAERLHAEAPHLGRLLAPIWLASPYEVPSIPDSIAFDAVFVLDGGAVSLAEVAGAIRRAKQTVVFGDPVAQTPTPFELAVRDPELSPAPPTQAQLDRRHASSALARLGRLLPTLELTKSYRAGGEDLAELVNRRFYGGKIQSVPWAGTFLGHGSLVLDYVAGGVGMPDPESGAVESPEVEVARVVDLVLEHAAHRGTESLMVVTASYKHAVRVQQAVLRALTKRGDLTEFFTRDNPEPFMVLTLDQATAHSRDRVILSVGYGRTPHGRTLSSFGTLGQPGGERLLAAAMTRARRSLVVVSCFRPADIDEDRLDGGIVALGRILADAEARTAQEPIPDDSDAMLVDLSRRLESHGLTVGLGYHGKLPLVAAYGPRAITIETDETVGSVSLRESLRMRPDMLKRLGWHYLRVHSFELFSDPDSVAMRIAVILGAKEQPQLLTTSISTIHAGQTAQGPRLDEEH